MGERQNGRNVGLVLTQKQAMCTAFTAYINHVNFGLLQPCTLSYFLNL